MVLDHVYVRASNSLHKGRLFWPSETQMFVLLTNRKLLVTMLIIAWLSECKNYIEQKKGNHINDKTIFGHLFHDRIFVQCINIFQLSKETCCKVTNVASLKVERVFRGA